MKSIMTRICVAPALIVLTVLVAFPSPAHHPLDEMYVREDSLTVSGTVSRVQWTNPHVIIALEVELEAGIVENWNVEVDPPNALARRSWTADRLVPGAVVEVVGHPARDGLHWIAGETLTLENGETLTGLTEGSWGWRRFGNFQSP